MNRPSLPARAKSPAFSISAALAGAAAAAAAVNYSGGRRAERLHPPTGRILSIGGSRIHVQAAGEGAPVVLLHGNGTMVHDWLVSGLFDRLSREHHVIAIDRPGYGYTERSRDRIWTAYAQADLVWRTLAQLGVEQPIFVGHSWGTQVALALALEQPDRVRGLVLLSGYYFPTARPDVWAFSPPAIPIIGDVMRYTVSPPLARLIAPRLIRKVFEPLPVPPRFLRGFPLELALRPWQLRASAEDSALMVPGAAALRKRYGELRVAVQILSGTEDRIVTPERQSMRLHAALPGSQLTLLPGLGHMIHYTAQDEIAQAIDAVAAGTERRWRGLRESNPSSQRERLVS